MFGGSVKSGTSMQSQNVPFEVWVKPKGGIAVKVHEKLTVPAGTNHELKLGDVLGAVEVFGDNFPRADKVVLVLDNGALFETQTGGGLKFLESVYARQTKSRP